jgi:GntR family transcriptional regulator, transcriptional repressor for pyruvate dehydrogenase complex
MSRPAAAASESRPADPARVAFTPARVSRTYDAVVGQVRGAIADGRLKPGDRLPSALELSREFEVSRNAVLEALRVLERSGLVSLRRGSRGGAFVCALSGDELTEPLHLMMETEVPVIDMVEIRRVIEGNTAGWAATRATQRELDAIQDIVSQWEWLAVQPEPEHWQQALAADARFHTMVADASHNAAASAFVRGILGSLDRMMAAYPYPREAMLAASAPLRWVFEPIAAHDPVGARERMQRHIGDFSELAVGTESGRFKGRKRRIGSLAGATSEPGR